MHSAYVTLRAIEYVRMYACNVKQMCTSVCKLTCVRVNEVASVSLLPDRAKPSRRYNHDGMDVDNSACHYGCETLCPVVLPRLLPIKVCALSNIALRSMQ